MGDIKACIFDAYGTLFDVNSAARHVLSDIDDELAMKVAVAWRLKQLQYTWIRSLAGRHADFWEVTCNSLDWSLEQAGIDDLTLRRRMLDLYMTLDAYPEVGTMFRDIRNTGLKTAILSNGTPGMLDAAVNAAGLADCLDDIFSIESVGIYKPDPRVYDIVNKAYGIESEDVLFVSSNGWDAAGAASFGFRSVWVNRSGEPAEKLPWQPVLVLEDLSGLAEHLGAG